MRPFCLLCFLFLSTHPSANGEGSETLYRHNKHIWLKAHNSVRFSYGMKPVKWNDYLARQALNWATHLSRTCQLLSSGNEYGENISIEWGTFPTAPIMVVKKWVYKGFSEVIWKESRFLGCGKAYCIDPSSKAHGTIYVCNYFPREKISDEITFMPALSF